MLLANVVEGERLGIGEAAITALLGYAVVFMGLIALMIVVTLLGKAFSLKKKEQKAAPAASAPVEAAPVAAAEQPAAPGTAGELKLHNVSPKTAAMLMAIVAEQTGKPLNELRFTSIKEVE